MVWIGFAFIGPHLSAIVELQDRNERFGIATSLLSGMNQRQETVMSCEFKLLIRKVRLVVNPDNAGQQGVEVSR
jgi:acyl dehydratase